MLDTVFSCPLAKKVSCAVVLALVVTIANTPVRAASAEGSDAEKRATLFQVEARKILVHDRWAIVREGKTGFTAVHAAASGGATSSENHDPDAPPLIVHVSLAFTPKGVDSTDCAVKMEGFRYTPQAGGRKPKVHGPYKADYPENANYIRKVLEAAEDQLGKKYPKYEAR